MKKTSPYVLAGKMKRFCFSPPGAFTLIEMLTTMAIVAVLVALVVPNLSKGIDSSKTTQCASNLRQIGLGLLTYAADHEGQFPPGSSWDKEIAVYLDIATDSSGKPQLSKVFQCPVDPKPQKAFQRSYTVSRRGEAEKADSANKGVFGRPVNSASPSVAENSRRLSAIKYPAYAILAMEKFEGKNLQYGSDFNNTDGWTGDEDKGQTHFDGDPKKPYFHRIGANYVFCDGHVELLARPAVLAGLWSGWRGGRWMVDQ